MWTNISNPEQLKQGRKGKRLCLFSKWRPFEFRCFVLTSQGHVWVVSVWQSKLGEVALQSCDSCRWFISKHLLSACTSFWQLSLVLHRQVLQQGEIPEVNSCAEIIWNLLPKKPAKACSSMAGDHGLCGGGAHGSQIGSTAEWFGQQLWSRSLGREGGRKDWKLLGAREGETVLDKREQQNGVTSANTVFSFRIGNPSGFPFLYLDM